MNGCETLADARRRLFLTRTAATPVGGALVTAVPPGASAAPGLARVTYPSLRLGTLAELRVNEPKVVTYPVSCSNRHHALVPRGGVARLPS